MLGTIVKGVLSTERTVRQKWNLISAILHFLAGKKRLRNYPAMLTVDPCNHCNLNCKLCPSGTKQPGRQQAMMEFDLFKKLMDECGPYLWQLDLFNWGEPLLNKNIFKMIQYVQPMRVPTAISSNLNHFSKDICQGLVESGLTKLIVSLDGASRESVEAYQHGSDFETVIGNIKQVVGKKRELGVAHPFVQWRFLVNKYNEHEIDRARELAVELEVDQLELGMFRCDMGRELFLGQNAQYESVQEWLPEDEQWSMYDYTERRRKSPTPTCRLLWYSSIVHPDGAVSPCCAVWPEKLDFGSIVDSSFKDIWNNEAYREARRLIRHKGEAVGASVCAVCKRNKAYL
jgi:radical SAM protein with 4Fe4S-binding SPASM domain